jgi:hypothetical protein
MLGERRGRHTPTAAAYGHRRAAARLSTTIAIAVIVAASWLMVSLVPKAISPVRTVPPASRPDGKSAVPLSRTAASPAAAPQSQARSGSNLVLSARALHSCPPTASACADLGDHITWLQSDGRIVYGPVRMEPGAPADPTPRGIFHVVWKAGAHYISTSFGVPIPYAVFFAPGGIAFHAGSLTLSSHGCIHLTLHNARYYHDHLPVGSEVDVF